MDEKTVHRIEAVGATALSRRGLADLAAVGAFVAVEVGAELIRRHLIGVGGGVLSTPTAALSATMLWTYLAHTRYAFRASPRTGLATLPPYIVLCLCLTVAASLIGRDASGPVDVATFASTTAVKFTLLRLWLWPLGTRSRNRTA